MADLLGNLEVLLNQVGLQQSNPKLYQFLKRLMSGTTQLDSEVRIVSSSIVIGGVTGSGTSGSLAQWNSSTSLTNVDAAGISAALDLL